MDFLVSYWQTILSIIGVLAAGVAWLSERKTRTTNATSGMQIIYKDFVLDYDKKYNELKAEAENFRAELNELKNKENIYETRISDLNTKIEKSKDEIQDLKLRISGYENQIRGYKKQVSSLKLELKKYKNDTRNN